MANAVTNTISNIEGTGIRCIGNLEGNFEQVPHSIFNYSKLGLISGNDLAVYVLLLKYDNDMQGYAFPTTKQIALETGISDKTVKQSTKRLAEAGLVKKEKAPNYPNKNIYYVYLPLDKEVLYKLVPHLVKEVEQKKSKYQEENEQDLQRLGDYHKQQEDGKSQE